MATRTTYIFNPGTGQVAVTTGVAGSTTLDSASGTGTVMVTVDVSAAKSAGVGSGSITGVVGPALRAVALKVAERVE